VTAFHRGLHQLVQRPIGYAQRAGAARAVGRLGSALVLGQAVVEDRLAVFHADHCQALTPLRSTGSHPVHEVQRTFRVSAPPRQQHGAIRDVQVPEKVNPLLAGALEIPEVLVPKW
jgi:hypothetical protein